MSSKANHIDFIELPADSAAGVAKAKAFYAGAFGWSFKDWGEQYADTESSGVNSGINGNPAHRPAKPLAVIHVADLEATKEKVLASGGAITKDIFAFPGGKRFHFTDPAGNELAAWSEG